MFIVYTNIINVNVYNYVCINRAYVRPLYHDDSTIDHYDATQGNVYIYIY